MTGMREAMDRLPDEVRWRIRRADGFLDLGMSDAAEAELARVPAAHHAGVPYRRMRLRLAEAAEQWAEAVALAEALCAALPEECGIWIELAYAKRRHAGIPEARSVLQEAHSRFPRIGVIPFNLACYACQEGNLAEARTYLAQAFAIEPRYREVALEDEDLESMWDEIE